MGKSQSKLSAKQLSDLEKHTLCKLFQQTPFTLFDRLISVVDRHELQRRYKLFLKGHPSGKNPSRLDKAGFCKMYREVTMSYNSDEFAGYLFGVFDKNRVGSVDLKEFMCALSRASRGSLEDKIKWAFDLYDINGGGNITQRELLTVVRSIYKMSGPMVRPSQDGDTPERWVENLFYRMDRNKDDKITRNELIEACRQDPTVLQALCADNSLA